MKGEEGGNVIIAVYSIAATAYIFHFSQWSRKGVRSNSAKRVISPMDEFIPRIILSELCFRERERERGISSTRDLVNTSIL